MPELPEVETIARGLERSITGRTIVEAAVRRREIVGGDSRFRARVRGLQVASVGRRGKFVVIALAGGHSLVVHLRMTGRLLFRPPALRETSPYTNVVLTFDGGERLEFSDVRRFGRMRFVRCGEAWAGDLGVEPLEESFTAERFIGMLAGRRTPVKALLLDQRRIAGIGNIYACEALWEARIRPTRPAGALSKPAVRRLHQALQSVLVRAIESHGTSIDDYVDADGMQGGFQNRLTVYGRQGARCMRCERPIVRTVLAQRGTWWCRRCQR